MTEETIKHAAEVATETSKQLPSEIAHSAWVNVFQAMILIEPIKEASQQPTT